MGDYVRVPHHVKCSDCGGSLSNMSHFKVCSDCHRPSCCDNSSHCKYCYSDSSARNRGKWVLGSCMR